MRISGAGRLRARCCDDMDDPHEAFLGRDGEIDRQGRKEADEERVIVARFADIERMGSQFHFGQSQRVEKRLEIGGRAPGGAEFLGGSRTHIDVISHRCFAASVSSARTSSIDGPPRSAARRRISSQEIVGGSGPVGSSTDRMNPFRMYVCRSRPDASRTSISVSPCPSDMARRILPAVSGSRVNVMAITSGRPLARHHRS